MTNEKAREEALPWRDAKDMVWKLRECKDYDDQARMLQSLACNLRTEAVKAERERCIIKIRSLAYEGKGMTNYGANKYNEALGYAEDAILSDDQEANNGTT